MGEASPGRVDVKVNRIYMKPLERAVVMSGNRLGIGRMQVEATPCSRPIGGRFRALCTDYASAFSDATPG